ncbi:MAG: type II toxin-antitoxin system ParD family antitoxin [Pirellulales bacterium]
MSVDIPPQYLPFVQKAIAAGRFESEGALVGEALKLLLRREREIKLVEEGLDELERGEYLEFDDEGLKQFLEAAQRQALEELRAQESTKT